MSFTHKMYSCRFCKKEFSSSQRLFSHLQKKNPCHPTLVIPKKNIDISTNEINDINIVNLIPSKNDSFLNPYEDAINKINESDIQNLLFLQQTDKMCCYCNKEFKNKLGLSYHLTSCLSKREHDITTRNKITEFINKCKDVINGQNILLQEQNHKNKILEQIINEDSVNKTKIIAHQTKIQEKTIDMLTYLQQHHKNTPNLEFPELKLSDDEVKQYIWLTNPLFHVVKKVFLDGKNKDEISMWCLDASREKFAIRDKDTWDIDYGCKKLINFAFNNVHNEFQRYVIKQTNTIRLFEKNENRDDILDINHRVINMHNDKAKKQFIQDACNEFNINKLFLD
uniref:C2H2-type domain-containing protein n=1 Tax=viral metagenome TaxID=1070528 RepID=A0A6C0LYI9_9ZZZZ